MTTNYPPGSTPTGPTGGSNLPPNDADAAWGCVWWWWVIIILIILFFWWAGWGWGPSGGYWFRTRPAAQPNTTAPMNRPANTATPGRTNGTENGAGTTRAAPTSQGADAGDATGITPPAIAMSGVVTAFPPIT